MADMTMPRTFREGLNMALRGEMQDVRFYDRMASIAPNEVIAQRIRYVRDDESSHANFLVNYLATGDSSQHQTTSMHDREFWSMAQEAYENEVHAIMMYAHLSLMAPNLAVAARLRDIMRDEMTHAEFFATLLMSRRVMGM